MASLLGPLRAQPALEGGEQRLAHHVVVRGQHAVLDVPLAQALRTVVSVGLQGGPART